VFTRLPLGPVELSLRDVCVSYGISLQVGGVTPVNRTEPTEESQSSGVRRLTGPMAAVPLKCLIGGGRGGSSEGYKQANGRFSASSLPASFDFFPPVPSVPSVSPVQQCVCGQCWSRRPAPASVSVLSVLSLQFGPL